MLLGLDGLPLKLAQELSQASITPNLARLALSPQARSLRSELPELSPVNWSSLATGANPGVHGVFGFTRINPQDYSLSLSDSRTLACPSIFERLGAAGYVSRILNLPGTYPVKPLRGMCVAGFVAPELKGAVYPQVLYNQLAALNYKLEADTSRGAADPGYLLAELDATLGSRELALNLMWPDLNWDMFVCVLTEFDRLAHFFLPALRQGHALHSDFCSFMRRFDRLIGLILARFDALPEPKRLLVMADHGFCELETELDLNAWLREAGYQSPDTLGSEWQAQRISSRDAAFALDPGRIYLHSKARFGRGGLSEQQAARLLPELSAKLMRISFRGRPALKAVHQADEIYSGPCLHRAPDLICEAVDGVSLTGKFDRKEVFGVYGRHGCHSAEGGIFYDSQGAAPHTPAGVGALILEHFRVGRIII